MPDLPNIDASWGGASSNAYTVLTSANAYFTTRVKRDAWDDATPAEQTAALIQATRDIDVAGHWVGERYYREQRLSFPRRLPAQFGDHYDWTGATVLGSPSTPEEVRMYEDVIAACCEQAYYLLDSGGEDELMELQAKGVRSYSEGIGKISESYNFGGTGSVLFVGARRLLGKYKAARRLERG